MTAHIETFAFLEKTAAPWWNTGLVGTAAKTWEEFQKAAGLDWAVKKVPLYYLDHNGLRCEQDEGYGIKRVSDQKILGVVGPKYHPIQNDTVFQWFNPWVQEGLAKFETAGALKGGKIVFALATVEGLEGEVRTGDKVRRHILLSNSHDGSASIRAGMTDIRVVCWNTLSAAHADRTGKLTSVRHTRSAEDALKNIQQTTTLLLQEFAEDLAGYKRLAEVPASIPAVNQYVREVVGLTPDPEENEKLSARVKNVMDSIRLATQKGIGNTGETWWDAYNGVTEVLTHSKGSDTEKRVVSNWFGDSAVLNKRALNLAYEYANVA